MSESNRVEIKYIPEVTYGTTPTNATTWQALRYLSNTLTGNPRTIVSNEISSTRQVTDLILVGQEIGGDINGEFSCNTYDALIEAAMCGAWTADVLKVGVLDKSFTIEKKYADWTTAQYLQYKGMKVNTMALNFAYGAVATCGFGFAGKTHLSTTTSLLGSGSVIAATTTDVLNGSSDISGVEIDGVAPTSIVKSIGINLTNNLRPIEGVGATGPQDQAYGRSLITGTIEAYFDDVAAYTKLLANTTATFEFVVGDGSNSYTFLFPKIKFNSGAPEDGQLDGDVMQRIAFTALYDSVEATSLKITRVP